MHLLSNKKGLFQIGATKKEMLQALNIRNRNETAYFQNLITNLSKYVEPLGLQIRYNPINSHWYISYDPEISDAISANPFDGRPRLAATLFCVLACCLQNKGIGKIHQIKELRNKKDVLEDLIYLEKMGYIQVDKDSGKVYLTPLIGYQLNLEQLFVTMALKLKKKESK